MPQPREKETQCRRCGKNRTWAWDALCDACAAETHQARVDKARGRYGRRAQLDVRLDPTGYDDHRLVGHYDEWGYEAERERVDDEDMRNERAVDRG